MIFPELNQSREAILNSVAAALQNPEAPVYLDTSVLLRCYELNIKARDDLLKTFNLLGERLRIPLWAAWETWQKSESLTPESPMAKPSRDAKDKLAALSAAIRRNVEEGDEPDQSATQLLADAGSIETALQSLTAKVINRRRDPEKTSELLYPVLNRLLLDSNVPKILKRVNSEAELRFAHNVPPGCGDVGKGNNRFGDLIIWFEVLADLRRTSRKLFLFITDDVSKGDWVHKPRMLLDAQNRPNRNESITVAHPMLVSEAKRECRELEELHIISLDEFAMVTASKLNIDIPHLLSALQKIEEPTPRTTPAAEVESPVRPEQAPEALAWQGLRSADLSYELDEADTVDRFIADLRSGDWRIVTKALDEQRGLFDSATRDQLLQIGRALASAATDGIEAVPAALDVLLGLKAVSGFERPLADDRQEALFLGVLAEIYLDETGSPKRPEASAELATVVFDGAKLDRFKRAAAEIRGRLDSQAHLYLALPGEALARLKLDLTLERSEQAPPTLLSISHEDNDLLERSAPPARQIHSIGDDALMSVARLMRRVSEEFVVPVTLLDVAEDSNLNIRIERGSGFIAWGPGTGVELRQAETGTD